MWKAAARVSKLMRSRLMASAPVGCSWNQIAEKLGVGRGIAERAFRSLSQKPLSPAAKLEHI
jgi:hypothetical protein